MNGRILTVLAVMICLLPAYSASGKQPRKVVSVEKQSICDDAGSHMKNVLKAGTAKVNLTPDNPKYPVHDSLYVRSLVLASDDVRIGFLSYDYCMYTQPEIHRRLKEKYGLDELYFCPSHTHEAEESDDAWVEKRFDKALSDAFSGMFGARISAGHRKFPPIAFNRLIVREDGHAKESWEADDHYLYINRDCLVHGPIDPSVGVLRVEDLEGNPKVLVMNFACHPDVMWNNFEISADYVGYATKYTEEAFDNSVNCLFIQGGAGNQAPLFKDGGRKDPDDPRRANHWLIERMGKLLSIETVKLARELYPNPNDVADIKIGVDSLHFTGRYDKNATYDPKFSAILLNNRIAIATFPGEPFIKFQLDWKRDMDGIYTPMFFGYTWNGGTWPIYVADVRSAALGGFGADNGIPLIEVGAGERIYAKILEQLYIINGLMRFH